GETGGREGEEIAALHVSHSIVQHRALPLILPRCARVPPSRRGHEETAGVRARQGISCYSRIKSGLPSISAARRPGWLSSTTARARADSTGARSSWSA